MASALAKTWLKQYMADSNFPEWTKTKKGITQPLLLPEKEDKSKASCQSEADCLLCERKFVVPEKQQELLRHLFEDHKLVIGDVNMVSDLPAYLAYWKSKFASEPLTNFCTVMKVDEESKKAGEGVKAADSSCRQQQDYFFLSDVLAEDKELRLHLQMTKLQQVLDLQEKERKAADFHRSCLFCRSILDSPKDLFNHMAFNHNFSVGQPDNLVYVDDLLDLLEKRLNDLVCIFCEKTFKNRDVLKEHMRKKSHKKINPKNSIYDKFYIVNYLEFGKTWSGSRKSVGSSRDFLDDELPTGFEDNLREELEDEDDEDEMAGVGSRFGAIENDWSDWRGDLSGAVCLFCPATYTDVGDLFNHLKVVHNFDYLAIKAEHRMSFYQQVKFINFIRRQVYLNSCLCCNENFCGKEELFEHMAADDHLKPPEDKSEWDHSQYLFPTYENDNLLCSLEDSVCTSSSSANAAASTAIEAIDDEESEEAPVIAEDIDIKESILFEEEFRKSLLSKSDKSNFTSKTGAGAARPRHKKNSSSN